MAGNDKKNELTSGEAAAIYKDFVENARDLIQCVNSEGKLVFVNQAWLSTLGYAAEEIENITLWDIIHPDSMEHCMAVFEQVLTGRAFGEAEAIFVAKDGTPVMVEGNVGVKLDENGRFVHTRGIFRNVTERKQAEEALQESESKFRFLAENMTDIIWTADLALNYTYVSPSMEKISGGYSAEELLGTPGLNTLTPASLEKAAEVFGEEMTAEQTGHKDPNRVITMELEHINRDDGSLYWVENNMAFIRDEKGEATGIFAVTRDITERKRAEEALKASEGKYREILSTIEEGYYEVDLAGNFVFFNDSFCKVLGYSRDELMQTSYKMIYKNSQEVFQTYNRVYRTGIAEKGADWPAITGNGQEIFIEVSITLRRDETGNPIGFRGIARDVSERKLVEEKLREHEKLQQLLMDLATDLINVPLEKVDEAINEMLKTVGEFTQVDRVYIFKHDYDRRVTSNTHEWCADGVPPEIDNLQDFPFERFTDFLEANQKGEIVNIPDVALMPANHAMCPIFEAQGIQSVIMLPLFSEDVNTGFVGFDAVKQKKSFTEQEIGLLKVLAEITSNVLTRQKTETNIRYISFHDQLTGLYNRHFLETEMARLNTKRQLPLAVIMADLNGLKLVNDTYGHETGDEMLKTAANIIRNSCREEDIISRFGGDEFVVLLPQTEIKEARLICKRIKEGCRDTFVEDVPVSIALGIATKTSETTSLIEALQEAENEMYRQKLTESRSTKSAVVTSLLNTLAEKSFETEEHTRGMKKIAQQIGAKLNLPDSELHRLELLINLHDIGKINISEAILTKKSSLTDDEWEAIKKHPEIGYRIAMATEEFAHVADDILAHHERWDGAGYPQGLKESGISLLARIVAIADAYEVMSNGRPYKKAMNNNEIIAEFRRCSGNQFDPELVEIILSVLDADG